MSNERTAGQIGSPIAIEAGTQALVSVASMQTPLWHLPPSAYDNLLVVSSTAPADVAEQLHRAGADLHAVGQIPVSGSEVEYDGPMWTCQRVVPDDLTGLSMRLSRAMTGLDGDRGWLLFDSLNVFLMYASEERVVRFFDHVASQTRQRDVRGVYALVRDALDDQTDARLCRCVDVEIDRR